jgi:U3 small nucleolar RNA-associated protein 10
MTETPDVNLVRAAISCLDTIIEHYGKSTSDAIVNAAQTVADQKCLGHPDQRIRELSLICLTTAVEALGAATVPFLAGALPKTIELLGSSITQEGKLRLHQIVCSFLSALLIHVPWMVSGRYLESIITLSQKSAEVARETAIEESRIEVLRLVARQVSAKDCLMTLKQSLSGAIASGPLVRADRVKFFRD